MASALEMRPYHCGFARFWPWPFGFSPKSSIALAASEDDVKDHAPQDVSLGTPLLYQKFAHVVAVKFWQNLDCGESAAHA